MPGTGSVVLLSGGMDSATLLADQVKAFGSENVKALSVDYEQRHWVELDYAEKIAGEYGVEHRVVNLGVIGSSLLAGSSQTSEDVAVPEGHYAEESMKLTVVPNRNMILISLAAAWAVSAKCQLVAYAAHAGDHAIYPDCRPEFVEAMRNALALCDWHPVHLIAPFTKWSKADIVAHGTTLGVNYSRTWSCYVGGEIHCGKCGTCVERREAFTLAKVDDPTVYADA